MTDRRLLTPDQLAAIRAMLEAPVSPPDAVTVDALLRLTVEVLLRHTDALTEQCAADRAVVEAATKLVALKREAAKAFPTGFDAIAGLIRTSGAHAMLARRIADAGKAVERAVNDRAGKTS